MNKSSLQTFEADFFYVKIAFRLSWGKPLKADPLWVYFFRGRYNIGAIEFSIPYWDLNRFNAFSDSIRQKIWIPYWDLDDFRAYFENMYSIVSDVGGFPYKCRDFIIEIIKENWWFEWIWLKIVKL